MEFEREGLYRLDANQFQLGVYNGKAVVHHSANKVSAKSKKIVDLLSLSISKLKTMNKDDFHNWAAIRSLKNRRQIFRMATDGDDYRYIGHNMNFQCEKYDVPYPDSLKSLF